MRLALLGDIHANPLALEAVLDAAFAAGVERLLLTGDLVGYYFSPKAVLELLQPWQKYMVRGNHEEMLCQSRRDPEALAAVGRRYGSGIEVAIAQLSAAEVDALCRLPHPLPLALDGRKILLCHGAPHDLDCYVYPDGDLAAFDVPALTEFDLVVTGHTHYPMRRVLGEKTLLVNPGSVGQPRNRQPGAHWALYDTASGEVSFHCERYDYAPLQAEARRRHPELPYLADVLGRT
ncbi:metallophosphoesterase family protein [Denitromonas sp.]|uniref:metallophosphoesterase family protein n=1 Tax=Denitromonas sp. TaxID=2734609 RepID=UPI002FDD2485